MVVPLKKKLKIFQDFCNLNNITKKDYFPLPFINAIIDGVVGHECYSFFDGFLGYN